MSKTLRHIGRILRSPLDRRAALRRLGEFHSHPRSLEDTVDWAMNFGTRGLYRVLTLQLRPEILALTKRVAELQPKVILEIGTARAGTLLIWSQLATELVISCDIEDTRRRAPLFERFPPPSSHCRVTLITGDSHQPALRQEVAQALAGRQVDFLFIDGDHTEAGVTKDFYDYRHLVRPGGLIAFHDIVSRQTIATNQVHGFWKVVSRQYPSQEFVDHPEQTGFGIGVVEVPACWTE